MDPDYCPFQANPKTPDSQVSAGAVDAHCDVFGPADLFPYSATRKYTSCDAPKERLFALHGHLRFARNVIVQASYHGSDNRALIDALQYANGMARCVAVVAPEVSDDELAKIDRTGVRAVRFNFVKRLVDTTPKEVFFRIAKRFAELGWHNVVYFEASDLPDQIPSFDDVVPFARSLVESFRDRVVWGTDWPHPNMKSHVPDDGLLTDQIARIAPARSLHHKLLIDNLMR